MDPSDYDIWVDDHSIDDDGNILTLARFARPGIDPHVGKVYWVGDGEQTPFAAKVIEHTRDGIIVLQAQDDAASALPA